MAPQQLGLDPESLATVTQAGTHGNIRREGREGRKKLDLIWKEIRPWDQDPLGYSVPRRFALQGLHVAHIVTVALGAVTIPIVSMKTRLVHGFRYMVDCLCHLLYYILYACQCYLLAA